jgi:outer membrane immunogenic protein
MLKKHVLSVGAAMLLALGLADTSAAADLPVKAPPRVAPEPVFSWTGFYIGAHAGWGWGDTDSTILEADNNFFPQGTINRNTFDGLLAGGQVGFNYQMGQWVIGVEGQFSWTDIDGSNRHDAILLANLHATTDTDVNWVTTLTGRLGMAFGPALVYVKGGGAWAEFESVTNSFVSSTGVLQQTVSGSETRTGWTVGGGIEYAFSNNWSIKGEYNFIDFGTERVTRTGTNFVTGAAVTRQRDQDTQLNIVKFGINYRLGFGGPVVASY